MNEKCRKEERKEERKGEERNRIKGEKERWKTWIRDGGKINDVGGGKGETGGRKGG